MSPPQKMATLLKHSDFIHICVVLLSLCGFYLAEQRDVGARESAGVELTCGEVEVSVAVKRRFFEERRVPFTPEHLRLGAKPARRGSCAPVRPVSDSEMLISAGLQECGAESRVHDEWLVYSNQLVLFPAVVSTATGAMIVRGAAAIVPVECHYKTMQTVHGRPLTPTWMPMTSTIGVFGLLFFSLRTMTDGCASPRASSVYQQGEAVFLEASVEAPLHPPLTVYVDYCVATLKPDPLSYPRYKFVSSHGCLMDSVLPDASSKFFPRDHGNRLCFSVQAFHFKHKLRGQMFITCHLRASLTENSNSHLNKACFFHKPTFSWRATEGDGALCECCATNDCLRQTPGDNEDHITQPDTETKLEADSVVGPLQILPPFHWRGHLSVTKKTDFNLHTV